MFISCIFFWGLLTQISWPLWCRLPLLCRGIYVYAILEAGNLFQKGWVTVWSKQINSIIIIIPPGRYGARCKAHHPFEHNSGFMWRRYMPPSGVCLCRISLADVMVIAVAVMWKHKLNTTSTNLWYTKVESFENIIPQIGLSTQLIDATSFV